MRIFFMIFFIHPLIIIHLHARRAQTAERRQPAAATTDTPHTGYGDHSKALLETLATRVVPFCQAFFVFYFLKYSDEKTK
jgi:hypothetical protein